MIELTDATIEGCETYIELMKKEGTLIFKLEDIKMIQNCIKEHQHFFIYCFYGEKIVLLKLKFSEIKKKKYLESMTIYKANDGLPKALLKQLNCLGQLNLITVDHVRFEVKHAQVRKKTNSTANCECLAILHQEHFQLNKTVDFFHIKYEIATKLIVRDIQVKIGNTKKKQLILIAKIFPNF